MFMSQYIYLNFVASIFLYVNGDTILNEKKNGECILPNHPANGKWIIIGGSDAQPGSSVSSLTAITYFCEEPYKLSSDYSLITCLGNHWNLLQPECLSDEEKTNEVKRTAYGEVIATGDIVNQRGKRYATPQGGRGGDGIVIKSGRRETVIGPGEEGSSYYDERGIARGGQGGTGVIRGGWNGNERQTRGQTYNGDGRGGYDEYYDELPEQTEDRISGRGGDGIVIRGGRVRGNIVGIGGRGGSGGYYRRKRATQNPPIVENCGEKRTRQFFVDGKNVKKTIYPWATAVYKKVLGEFQYFCGATMLTQRIFVTVAHCVTSYPDNDVIPAEKLKIAVGKYYQDYNNSKDTQAQFSDVMKVLVNPKYRGLNLRYAADIAFLITKDQLTLSNVVQPVCYQNIRNIDLNDELEGVLTGWGFPDSTSVSPSNELQGIPLPFQNEAICLKEIPEDFGHDFLAYDKMCMGYYNKSMKFCGGISGNSLTFPYNGKYYIHGIISIGKKDSTQGLCNILAKSTLYTKVSAHYDWLERVISQYQ
ncbi:unnamed protein product [Psylliodes chrysocephalus]|uniref:Uncharacterized protein n=1 Tax=Psylliodes chrysocephalus TaxID=3402493 RepID=A0A9P0CGY7_9CUCU|nr:unnamed protein product [Psylliodes chrysocephala]